MKVAEAVRAVAEAGYDGIELSLHEDHLHPDTATDAELRELRRTLDDVGLRAVCLATGAEHLLGPVRHEPSLVSPEPEGRRRREDLVRRALDMADALDVPVVGLSTGILGAGRAREPAYDHLLTALRHCLDHRARASLALEPEPGFFVETTAQAAEVIEALGDPRLRMNMDIGHVRCVEDDFLAGVRRGARYSSNVHIEDIAGRVHHHQIPGDGDIDFVAVLDAMDGYQGYLSVELYHHAPAWRQALPRSLAHLRGCIEQLRTRSR